MTRTSFFPSIFDLSSSSSASMYPPFHSVSGGRFNLKFAMVFGIECFWIIAKVGSSVSLRKTASKDSLSSVSTTCGYSLSSLSSALTVSSKFLKSGVKVSAIALFSYCSSFV